MGGLAYSAHEDATLLDLRDKGVGYKDIAKRLGRTHQSVKARGMVLNKRGATVDTVRSAGAQDSRLAAIRAENNRRLQAARARYQTTWQPGQPTQW
jgi:hypothetical protein